MNNLLLPSISRAVYLGVSPRGRRGSEDVGAKVVSGNLAVALLIQTAHKRAIQTWTHRKRLAQIANGRASAHGVVSLLRRRQGAKVGAKGVHNPILTEGYLFVNTFRQVTYRY